MSARPPVPAASRRPGRAAERGFTLLELMLAFAILALTMVYIAEIQHGSTTKAWKALAVRDLRVMADTVFRRIVYEHFRWDDGQQGWADEWYADFAGVPPGPERERWKLYRLELRKRKGLVAGTDPDGSLDALFDETTGGTGTGTSTGTGSSGTGGSGASGGSGTEKEPTSGEAAYVVELSVYFQDGEEPELVLRSVLPLPESEREEAAK